MKILKKKKISTKKVMLGVIVLLLAVILFLLFSKDKEYKITFNSNGGTPVNEQFVIKNKKLVKPESPLKEGYEFLYWELDGKEYDFNQKVTKSFSLVAKFKDPNKLTYFVTFNSSGGTAINPIEVEKDGLVIRPDDPTKEGYDFVSWQLNNEDFDFNTKINQDLLLVAKWEEKSNDPTDPIKHRVSFNSDGGSAVSSKLVEKGTKVSKPKNPTKSGYSFLGWYLNNKLFNFSTKIYDNITLNAKWKAIEVEEEKLTYSIVWIKIDSSSIGQYTLYIKSSENKYVSGKAKITTTAGTTSIVDIPSTGKVFIKSAVASATVESVN